MINYNKTDINGASPRFRFLAVLAKAGLIRSIAHPPYGELSCYARIRVYRRAADSGPPNKTLDSVVT
jgi:hypothetical protein